MRASLISFVALCACMPPVASADIYTWTDEHGRVNVSNIAPPEGVRVTRVVREAAPKPDAAAARDNSREVEVRALADRIRQLEQEVDAAKSAPPPPPMIAAPIASAPPQITIPVFNYIVAGTSPPVDATYDSPLGFGGWMPYAYPVTVAAPSMRRPYPFHPTARRPAAYQSVQQQLPFVAMGRLPLTFAR